MIELYYGHLFMSKGDGQNVLEHCQSSVKYCEECKGILILGLAWMGLGSGYYFLGELDKAQKHIEKGLKIQQNAGIPIFFSLHYWFLSLVYLDSGDLENARSSAEEALKLSRGNNERWVEGASRALYGRILGKADRSKVGQAEECILQGIKILDELQIRPYSSQGYLFLGELYADRGQKDEALENLKKAQGMFQNMGMDYWLARTREVLGRL